MPSNTLNRNPRKRFVLAAALLASCGCNPVRVVIVPATQPRQLAEPLQAYVYVRDKDGNRVRSSSRVPLYEGEYVLTDPAAK